MIPRSIILHMPDRCVYVVLCYFLLLFVCVCEWCAVNLCSLAIPVVCMVSLLVSPAKRESTCKRSTIHIENILHTYIYIPQLFGVHQHLESSERTDTVLYIYIFNFTASIWLVVFYVVVRNFFAKLPLGKCNGSFSIAAIVGRLVNTVRICLGHIRMYNI